VVFLFDFRASRLIAQGPHRASESTLSGSLGLIEDELRLGRDYHSDIDKESGLKSELDSYLGHSEMNFL
jgi:hypothetical protein